MAAFSSFSLFCSYATTGRIVAIVRASPRLSSSLTSINFLTPNHPRRDGNGSTHMWRLSNIAPSFNMQSQLICSGCRSILLYPRGATSVCCALCNTITPPEIKKLQD
ncbi:uncharacterized protein LOC105779805 isoform X2 [Gossypium raimondii]|uniref:uncharacterized protein LOC105779805 isoform X2 n=1 Tax=Gossypium raimondii TaxID=29730 RepID=UPI00063ADE0C|nr:uncharacterized protein LOC105779805 isoform X2 [Gossypium raimondii]XP_052487033.1 uncharacterized protein LOC105779805 isoform X2 [Gossypium raimondii]